MITFPAFTVLCVTHAQQSSAVRLYFLRKGPGTFISARFLHRFTGFSLWVVRFSFTLNSHMPSRPPTLSRFNVRHTPMFFFFVPFKPSIRSSLFMSPIDLMHGDFVLDFCALCNICHWVIVPPVKREEADYNKEIPWHLEYAWESWDILFFACYDSSQIVWLISLVGSEWDERSETRDCSSHFETCSRCIDHFWVCWVSPLQPWGLNDTSQIPFLKPLQ